MRVDYTAMEWSSGVLSDRRKEGGGIAWLVRMTPPRGSSEMAPYGAQEVAKTKMITPD